MRNSRIERELNLYKEEKGNYLTEYDERAIYEALKVFDEAAHSGFSASCIPSLVKIMLSQKNKKLELVEGDFYGNMIRMNINEAYDTISCFANNATDENLEKIFNLTVKLFMREPLCKLTFCKNEWSRDGQNNRLTSVFKKENGDIEYLRDVMITIEKIEEDKKIVDMCISTNSKLFFWKGKALYYLDLSTISLNIKKYIEQEDIKPASIYIKGVNFKEGYLVESFYIDKILEFYNGKTKIYF